MLPSFLLLEDDIVAGNTGKTFGIPPSPSAVKSAAGMGGRITGLTVPAACTLAATTISQIGWQSFGFNTGTITIKCLINGVPQAATIVLQGSAPGPATTNPVTSNGLAGIALAKGDVLSFTADMSNTLDASGLTCLVLLPSTTG